LHVQENKLIKKIIKKELVIGSRLPCFLSLTPHICLKKIFANNNFETAQITTHVLHLNKNKINNKK